MTEDVQCERGKKLKPCRHCGKETAQQAEGVPYCSMDCIGRRRRELNRETLECPYPDCDWEATYLPENGLSRDIAFSKADTHREEHRAELRDAERPGASGETDRRDA